MGDMSFVGPRPERPEFVADLTRQTSRTTASATSCGRASPAGPRCATPTARASRTRSRSCSTTCSTSRTCRLRSTSSSSSRPSRPSFSGAGPSAMQPEPIVNAMSIDVEDYFHVSVFDGLVPRSEWDAHGEPRVPQHRPAARPLRASSTYAPRSSCSAGWRSGIRTSCGNIAARGHEIASHGYAHRLIYDQTPAAFRDDVRRAKPLLEDASGQPVAGYRAPSYSITPAVALGARHPGRRRLPVRLEHFSDSARSLRHSRSRRGSPYRDRRGRPARSSRCPARRRASGR